MIQLFPVPRALTFVMAIVFWTMSKDRFRQLSHFATNLQLKRAHGAVSIKPQNSGNQKNVSLLLGTPKCHSVDDYL